MTKQTPKQNIKSSNKFKVFKMPVTTKDITLKCTRIPILKEIIKSSKFKELTLTNEIDSGGEGTTYLTNNNLVAKIYKKNKLTKLRYEKLSLMVSNQVDIEGVCWPLDLIYNDKDEFVGFLMDKAEGIELQKSVFLPMLLEKRFPNWNRNHLVRLCYTILCKIEKLHELNIILGDINPNNFLIKNENTVYFIDTDSFQIENYPCPVGTVNYTAPEIQGIDYSTFLRNHEHEYFALATLLFMILLPGKPPYSQQGGTNPSSNIKNQDFSYPLGEKSNQKTPPGQWRFIWSNLPYKIKEAFYVTFKENQRLSTKEWIKLFESYLYDLKKKHVIDELFPSHLKINDPTNVKCTKCFESYTESKSFIQKLATEGKEPICIDCRKQFIQKTSPSGTNSSTIIRSNSYKKPQYQSAPKKPIPISSKPYNAPKMTVLSVSKPKSKLKSKPKTLLERLSELINKIIN